MADNNSTTRINLEINGKQAEQTIKALEDRAVSLRKSISEASNAGDTEKAKKLNKELDNTKKSLKEIQSVTKSVEDTMKNLDKASPRDLKDTLKVLQKQLNGIERGSVAWTEQTEKIKKVKAQLMQVNSEMAVHETLLQRMNRKFNDWGASIMAAGASLAGLVAAGKKAVTIYAEMDQEMANVRKFTGMTAEEVAHMNEEFKKIDTRTSRDNLNKLAQEAGRLGKTSEEDVLGFVKAADKINVALDDLGEGATLTLSKLTNIFGDEARYGTEQSLLKVGSVINELSQNCTASAPYLAQFAQRLAGVGAQAGMTIPQIMGFGAVLDSQGQAVEMSASALSKLIMNLFKNADKICAATGMNVKQFKETAVRDTNEALIMLLERLHEMGNMDALAPLFQEMGENGVRSSQVLAALAGNIDMVKQQQEAANVAFEEGISIDKEFNVQNTTVQAGLEKARKGFQEMAVTLGKELMPIVSHLISGTSMTMRGLLKTIEFIKEYKGAILGAAAGIAYYTVVTEAATIKTKLHNAAVAVATAMQNAWNKSIKANPWTAVIAVVIAATTAIAAHIKKLNEATIAEKAEADARKKISDQYNDQRAKIDMLNAAVHDETMSLKNRRDALKQLQELVPSYHASLTDEGKLINDNKDAIENYLVSLQKEIEMQVYREKLEELYRKRLEAEENVAARQADYETATANAKAAGNQVQMRTSQGAAGPAGGYINSYAVAVKEAQGNLEGAKKSLDDIDKAIGKIGDHIKDTPSLFDSGTTAQETPTGGSSATPGGTTSAKERFKAEEEWRAMEEAKARIAYARGESNYTEYTERMQQISVDFYKKELEHTDLSEKERLEITANYEEALKKQRETAANGTIEQENERYNQLRTILQQQYANGELSAREYNNSLELAELEHLKNMVDMYEEGTKERLKAEKDYQDAQLKQQIKHAEESRKLRDKLEQQYFAEKKSPNSEAYTESKAALDQLYQELAAKAQTDEEKLELERQYQEARYLLAKEYNDTITMEQIDSTRAMGEAFSAAMEKIGDKMSSIWSQVSATMSAVSDLVSAECDLQVANIESRYEKEIAAAGENEARVAQLEQKKQDEISAVKSAASKKQYEMDVISTIAQGAIAATAAWTAGWETGPAGVVLAPLFMALSLATTAIQLATLKKQQEAAAATGYAGGGYTTPGPKYQPAGIVHAGEWVATQETLANPTAAAAIATIDQAQRTNSLGSLSRQDVSRSVSGTAYTAQNTSGSQAVAAAQVATNAQTAATLAKLNQRLNEPFVTVNTASGDKGIKKAINLYDRMNRGGK